MSVQRPSGPHLNRGGQPDKVAEGMGELCPDDALLERVRADMLAAGEYVSPSRLRRKLDRLKASGDCYQDLTYRDRRRRASVPADLAVGERVARGGDA